MIEALRRALEAKVSSATLERSPFPHLIIEEFFPPEIYAKILEYNPFINNKGEEWLARSASNNVSSQTPYHARKQINFHAGTKFDVGPDANKFWENIKKCFLNDNWFESLIVEKYHEYFQLRFGDIAYKPDFTTYFQKQLFLQRHEPGYYIGPHTDIPTRVFTCIFSFASVPGFEEYGTELLAHKDPMVRCWGHDHYQPADFVIKKIAPYTPNNFLLFFKTRQSFHSVRSITEQVPNQRYGMQFQFYEPAAGLLKDLSAPDIMVLKQRGRPAGTATTTETGAVSLIAAKDTFLKLRPRHSTELSEAEKLEVRKGDILDCEELAPLGDHSKVSGVRLNEITASTDEWFLYTPHWRAIRALETA